eukprot:c16671_g1_i1 orf=105-674(+)
MLGLALRHNSLHHLFALFLTLALATLCWCCWRRGRSYQRRQELLPRGVVANTASSSPPSSPSSSAPTALTPAPTRLDPGTAALLPILSYRAHLHTHTGELASPDVDDYHHGNVGDDDDDEAHGNGDPDLLIKNSDCAICLSSFEPGTLITVLPSCNHAYHPSCIHQWVQSHKDCPICRTEISLPAATTL